MSRTTKAAKKTGRKPGRQVASGPGNARSRTTRPRPSTRRKAPAKKPAATAVPELPSVPVPPAPPATAVEHAERPHPLGEDQPADDPEPTPET